MKARGQSADTKIEQKLNLFVGEEVQVRSESEILSTLDNNGMLDGLPFMPEMRQYCGKRFRVYKRADKTCDTIGKSGLRRMQNAVHLVGLRCDGESHGGCEAGCMLFWKEAWLKRVTAATSDLVQLTDAVATHSGSSYLRTMRDDGAFICQATELRNATSHMPEWDIRHYFRDLWFGNIGLWHLIRAAGIWVFNTVQTWRSGRTHPFLRSASLKRTTADRLYLEEGELVRVKSKEQILATLDANFKNRGLWFDKEMVPYCGKEFRVLRRVGKIINERTGQMMRLPNDCLILEGVICKGHFNRYCPRSIFPYWREVWLERVNPVSAGAAPMSECETACAGSVYSKP